MRDGGLAENLKKRRESTSGYRDVLNALNRLSGDLAQAFELFGERGHKGWQIVKERGVKKYLFKPSGKVIWIVVGKQREYLIYEKVGYCSCDDFYFHVMDGKAFVCQHLIAQRLAGKLGWYNTVEEEDGLIDSLMQEWRSYQPIAEEVSKN